MKYSFVFNRKEELLFAKTETTIIMIGMSSQLFDQGVNIIGVKKLQCSVGLVLNTGR